MQEKKILSYSLCCSNYLHPKKKHTFNNVEEKFCSVKQKMSNKKTAAWSYMEAHGHSLASSKLPLKFDVRPCWLDLL